MGNNRSGFGPLMVAAALACAAVPGGCGVLTTVRTVFPQQVLDAQGNPLYVEDLLAITDDPDLTDADKTDALRALGIEDEDVINALIAGGFTASPAGVDGLAGTNPAG